VGRFKSHYDARFANLNRWPRIGVIPNFLEPFKYNKGDVVSVSIKRYLVVDQCVVPGLFNALLGGWIAWSVNRELHEIPFWGSNSVAYDFLLTAISLPFIVWLIVSPLVAYQVRKGKIDRSSLGLVKSAWLPSRSVWVRAILATLISIALSAPVFLLWFWFGPESISVNNFIAAKIVFVTIVSGAMTALIAWWAVVDASRKIL